MLEKEVQAGRIAGPFSQKPFETFQISPIKVIPKKSEGYRLLHNLSYPYDETSVNAGIPDKSSTVSYASIQDAIDLIQYIGQGTFLCKSDLKSAFRMVPIHPDDYPLLGIQFHGMYYFDRCLAQGSFI